MGLSSTLHTAGAPARAVWTGAGVVVDRLDRVIGAVEQLSRSIQSIEVEMRGMRADLRDVNGGIDSLRRSVVQLDERVAGIRDATASLDRRVEGLEDSLRHVDALARSVPRIGRRAREARAVPQPPGVSP